MGVVVCICAWHTSRENYIAIVAAAEGGWCVVVLQSAHRALFCKLVDGVRLEVDVEWVYQERAWLEC